MPLSRILGYYCLMLLLCGVAFGHWVPPPPDTPETQTEQSIDDAYPAVASYYAHRRLEAHPAQPPHKV